MLYTGMEMDLNKRLISRFGLFLGLSLLLLSIVSYMEFYLSYGQIKYTPVHLVLISLAFAMIFTRNYRWSRHIQILTLTLLVAIVFYKAPRRGLGIPLFFLLSLLSQKYGYLSSYRLLKGIIVISVVVVINIISLKSQNLSWFMFLPIFLFGIMFFVSFYIINLEMFMDHLKKEREQKKEITSLKCKLSEITEFIDPVECGLTSAELEILELLCLYKSSNADLAKRLNKSVSTIKVQLSKIYNKIGCDNRHQLIDLCEQFYKN